MSDQTGEPDTYPETWLRRMVTFVFTDVSKFRISFTGDTDPDDGLGSGGLSFAPVQGIGAPCHPPPSPPPIPPPNAPPYWCAHLQLSNSQLAACPS